MDIVELPDYWLAGNFRGANRSLVKHWPYIVNVNCNLWPPVSFPDEARIQLCIEKTKIKEKEAVNGPFFNKKKNSNVWAYLSLLSYR